MPPWETSHYHGGRAPAAEEPQKLKICLGQQVVRCSAYEDLQLTLAAEVIVVLTFALMLRKLLEKSSWNRIRIPVGWGVVCLPWQKF